MSSSAGLETKSEQNSKTKASRMVGVKMEVGYVS
jgi:hypothetical protein